MSSTTPSPEPRADLRTLAAERDAPMTDQVAPSPQSLCDHPVYVHKIRLAEAADAIRRLAAAAPPAGLSAPVPAENAPAVPEEADGQRAKESDDESLHAPDDVYRLIAADRAARWDYVHTLPPEDLAAYIRTQSLDPNLREDADTAWWAARSRYGKQRDRALAVHQEEFERANRLAAQVAHYQRVVERVRTIHQFGGTAPLAAHDECRECLSPWPCPTITAVDALPDAGTDQTEDNRGST